MSEHRCHAVGCQAPVRPALLMCLRHWRLVPRSLRNAVWRTYRKGQEIDKCPSPEYMAAQRAAIDAVAEIEGRTPKGVTVEGS